jgi:catechol 2,3-dioxygenase-like lactoylglutathione lyase family enzyme
MNMVLQNFDESLAHFQTLFGADLLYDIPQPEMHACVIDIGRVLFEIFVPHAFLLNARYGAHYLGLEYQADMGQVREVVAARGMRIIRDIGEALHTHPQDGFGIAFEFYDGEFHSRHYETLGRKLHPAEYWRDTHPLGLTGMVGYSVAVFDLDAALRFFQSFLGAEVAYEARRKAIGGRAVGLQVADGFVELIAAEGDGDVQQYLRRFGEGIRATVFRVRDVEQAKRYFSERGIEIAVSGLPDAFALPAAQNLGVTFEFTAA